MIDVKGDSECPLSWSTVTSSTTTGSSYSVHCTSHSHEDLFVSPTHLGKGGERKGMLRERKCNNWRGHLMSATFAVCKLTCESACHLFFQLVAIGPTSGMKWASSHLLLSHFCQMGLSSITFTLPPNLHSLSPSLEEESESTTNSTLGLGVSVDWSLLASHIGNVFSFRDVFIALDHSLWSLVFSPSPSLQGHLLGDRKHRKWTYVSTSMSIGSFCLTLHACRFFFPFPCHWLMVTRCFSCVPCVCVCPVTVDTIQRCSQCSTVTTFTTVSEWVCVSYMRLDSIGLPCKSIHFALSLSLTLYPVSRVRLTMWIFDHQNRKLQWKNICTIHSTSHSSFSTSFLVTFFLL